MKLKNKTPDGAEVDKKVEKMIVIYCEVWSSYLLLKKNLIVLPQTVRRNDVSCIKTLRKLTAVLSVPLMVALVLLLRLRRPFSDAGSLGCLFHGLQAK